MVDRSLFIGILIEKIVNVTLMILVNIMKVTMFKHYTKQLLEAWHFFPRVTCNQRLYKNKCRIKQYVNINSNENKNCTIMNDIFITL